MEDAAVKLIVLPQEPDQDQDDLARKCKPRERLWAETYIKHLNKRKTCIELGYPAESAAAAGKEIYSRPHVRAYIDQLVEINTCSAEENIKRISDLAEANLSDYMIPIRKIKSDPVHKPLQVLIDELDKDQEMDDEYTFMVTLTKPELIIYEAKRQERVKQKAKYQIELRHNPSAYRIVQSPPYIAVEMELDLEAIARDKEGGKIKTFKHTRDGIQIEMYSTLEASNLLAKIKGSFKEDNDQKKNIVNLEELNVVFR